MAWIRTGFIAVSTGLVGVALVVAGIRGVGVEDAADALPTNVPDVSASAPVVDWQTSLRGVTPETMEPNRLLIPRLGVYAEVVAESVSGGELGIPEGRKVGIAQQAAAVSAATGTVVVAGHVVDAGARGALYELFRTEPGWRWYVTDSAGNRAGFVVVARTEVHKSNLPPGLISNKGPRRGVLVTCAGPISTINGRRVHRDNLLVYSIPM